MGSYNSGRTGGRPTSEACASYVLDVSLFNRARLRPGILGTVPISFGDGFEVSIMIDTRGQHYQFLALEHTRRNGDGGLVRYEVQLVQTRPNYGGIRLWFLCPRSGRRVTKLFLPRGGAQFWSRKAYGLGYACQRLANTDRVHLQGRKNYRSLGGDGDWQDEYPDRPKWMRWRTYERKIERLDTLANKLEALWEPRIARLLRRYGTRA